MPMQQVIQALADKRPRIFIGHRPGKKTLDYLKSLQLTHCCTLLREREGAQAIQQICDKLDYEWVWLPIKGGRLEMLAETDIAGHLQTLYSAIADEPEPRLYLHCSAGIHRTGFFAYLLLRLQGHDPKSALAALADIREVTATQVGQERLTFADNVFTSLLRD